jgi:mannose-6-phosphate isomerase-like protein (cupin superfamily)
VAQAPRSREAACVFESEAAERLAQQVAADWFRDLLAATPERAAGRLGRAVVLESRALRRDAMPPLHAHDVDESYRVLEGEVVFHVGGERVHARAGDVVVAPRHVPRTFRVVSERARWLVITSLRSLARYEDFQRAVAPVGAEDEPAWASEEDYAVLTGLAAANGIEILGPPGLLPSAP